MTAPRAGGLPAVDTCLNCGADVAADAYCSACGQRAVDVRIDVRGLLHEAVAVVASLDSKLFRTAWALVRRPGVVAAEYLAGHRVRWVSPVRVFLGAAAVYVLLGSPYLQNLSGQQELRGLAERAAIGAESGGAAVAAADRQRLAGKFQRLMGELQRALPIVLKAAFVLSAPALVALLALVEAGKNRPLYDHAVTGLYWMAIVALFRLVEQPLALLLRTASAISPLRAQLVSTVAVGVVYLTVLVLWLRRIYGDRPGPAVAKALVVLLGLEVATVVCGAVTGTLVALVYVL